MIDLTVHQEQLRRTVQRARERDIIIPTFAQMKDPSGIPNTIKEKLARTGLWDTISTNLFRITWKNETTAQGGGYGDVNYIELPPSMTGVPARIICLVGEWFPTGSHKVGATFGCLVPRLITGQFDPTFQKAVWPSTGNYCRGGAYDATLLACESVANTVVQLKATVDGLIEASLRDLVKIMIGGAPVTEAFAKDVGANACAPNVASAAYIAR